MDNQPDTQKVIMFAALGVTLCVLMFTFAFSQLIKDKKDSATLGQPDKSELSTYPPNPTTLPTDVEGTNLIAPVTQTDDDPLSDDWHDTINEFVYEDQEIPEDESDGGVVEWSASVDDLSHLDLGLNPAPQIPVPTTTPTSIPTSSVPTSSIPVVVEYESLDNTRFDDCGTLVVPTGYALTLFPYTAGTESTAVCMGEAVADDCEASHLALSNNGLDMGMVYVVERNDGVCSVGLSVDDVTVSLCSVKAIMNNGTGESKSMSAWQNDFEDNPGTLFASMYFSNTDLFASPTASEEFDCEVYEL